MLLRLFGYVLAIIGLIVMGHAIISSMDYMNSITSISSMYGYGNVISSDDELQAIISMALPGFVAGLIILGIGLLVAKK
jgi:hypothetical protein